MFKHLPKLKVDERVLRFKGGYRLDHLLLCGPWDATSCRYLHEPRTTGLSDQSPLLAELQPSARRAQAAGSFSKGARRATTTHSTIAGFNLTRFTRHQHTKGGSGWLI